MHSISNADGERIGILEGITTQMQPNAVRGNLSALANEAKANPSAFAELYNYYVQPVYRYLRSHVHTIHEAEDLTSQTFIAAYENLQRYRERGHFSAWLFRIARSKLVDHYRKSMSDTSLDAVENRAGSDDVLDLISQRDEIKNLTALVQKLDDHEQDLIRLRYVADLSFAEIAEVLGKREDAVKKSLYRLLATLKSQME
jgi:RNA polymerase sigma-70 factor (ECF subfamily)